MSATLTTEHSESEERQHAQLLIEGMTCASCATRIERRLNRLDGVSASVNYATEAATIDFDTRQVTLADLVAAVDAVGYRALLTGAPEDAGEHLGLRLSAAAVALGSRRGVGDDPGPAVRRLGVGRARAHDAGRALGRLAVPSRHDRERPPRRRDHGHPDLARDSWRRSRGRPSCSSGASLRTRTSRSQL